jgi:hypothetical protein
MNAFPVPGFGRNAFERQTPSGEARASAKLRVGVLVECLRVPNWAARLLGQLIHSEFAEIALVLVQKRDGSAQLQHGWESALFRAWSRLDRVLNARRGDAFDVCEVAPMLRDIRTIEIGSSKGECLTEALQAIRDANLDVIVALDGQPSADEIAHCAKYGLWSLPGSKQYRELAAPMFWASYRGSPVLKTALLASTPGRGAQAIYHSYSATNGVSPYLGQNSVLWKAGEFVVRRLSDLQRYGWDYARTLDGTHLELSPANMDGLPDNVTTGRFLLRWFVGALGYEFKQRLRKEQWFIAYRSNQGKVPMSAADMSGFTTITPPRDRFYADPFVVQRNGINYIFFEDYRYKQRKGLISCLEIDAQGRCGKPEVVLELPYHLSYPSVFEYEGETFLMPETRGNRTVELYRAVEFPRRWVLEKVLLKDVPAVDPTIFMHDGRVWIFVGGMVDNASINDELFLFSADSLFGEWAPHPRNPIVSDVRRARPAGQLFFHNGQLIRPSQNCSTRYGAGVSLNRVDALSATDYREVPIGYISAEWHAGNLGTHTLNQNDTFQVVDGRVLVFK